MCYNPGMGRSKLTKDIINSRISNRSIFLIGDYTNVNTKVDFCCDSGHVWQSTPQNIMNGNGCPKCAGLSPLSKDVVNERIQDRGIVLIGDYVSALTKSEFRCELNHVWKAKPSAIMGGAGCPVCAGLSPLSNGMVNERLTNNDRGIKLIGDYINSRTKTLFECHLGHRWNSTTNNVLKGSSCPKCSVGGFTVMKSAWIYVLVFNDYIKYGITNNLKRRLAEHKKSGDYVIATTKLYKNGDDALRWEQNIKIIFGGKFVTKDICPSGYTETLSITKLNDLLGTIRED